MSAVGVLGDVAGGAVIATQTQFTLNGVPVLLVGDPVTPHDDSEPPHDAAVMVQGAMNFTLNGIPVCRMGDLASCGHPLVVTQEAFSIS